MREAGRETASLFWFVEVELPLRMVKRGRSRYIPATYPGDDLPVVAVGQDWEASSHVAGVLAGLFADAYRRSPRYAESGVSCDVAITTSDLLQETGLDWYLWGEGGRVADRICPICGSVSQLRPGEWLECGHHLELPLEYREARRSEMGLWRVDMSWVDGQLWEKVRM